MFKLTNLTQGLSLQEAVALGRPTLYSEEPDQCLWYVPTLTLRTTCRKFDLLGASGIGV